MHTVHLHDTLSRQLKALQPERPDRFRMYVCGPTVYGPAHIGNFITFVRFDVLYRLLKACGYNPLYVRNITDVDDKTIKGSIDSGQSLLDFTSRWTDRFHRDCESLNLLKPDVEPKATDHIQEQLEMIGKLMDKGYAYVGGDGSVYYKVSQFKGYGKLSHFDPEALLSQSSNSAGQANLADEYDRDAIADFALWKAHKEADGPVVWDSPWGPGRPGWHLECSAMSLRYLGETFDLHGGGEDLCFPHHENEIAQSEAATGKPFARHWMHGVHLLVEGKKMSKSLGNFFTLGDLIDKGFDPMEIRLGMLGGHYRQQFNFTLNGLSAARAALGKLSRGYARLLDLSEVSEADLCPQQEALLVEIEDFGAFAPAWDAIRRDLNTPAALGALHTGLKSAVSGDKQSAKRDLMALRKLLAVLGVEVQASAPEQPEASIPTEIQELAEKRWQAKNDRDFAAADQLRDQLKQAGWTVIDKKDGYELQTVN